MKENKPFIHVGYFPDFEHLHEKVLSLTDETWREYKERKLTQGVASYATETIPLLYTPYATRLNQIVNHKYHDYFEQEIQTVCRFVSNLIGYVEEKQSMLTRLQPGGLIKPHKDRGPITAKTHRVHLPIATNDACTFTVGDTTMKMKPGEIWIIDNTDQIHSVQNFGDSPRIHLIVDMV